MMFEAFGYLVFPIMQMYNDRRLFFGGGPGIVPNDSFGSPTSSSPNADRRNSRSRGMLYIDNHLLLICTFNINVIGRGS